MATSDEDRLTVVNVVASTRVAEELNLPDIAIQLNCEYEPEQFPGVVYRVVDPKLAILMFRSGRAVCTGGKNEGPSPWCASPPTSLLGCLHEWKEQGGGRAD